MPQTATSKQNRDDPNSLAQAATDAALSSNWQEAAKINRKILSTQTDDVEALNRLARAYSCLGEIGKAQKTYKKVLGIDPYNIIAHKNLERFSKSATITKGSGLTPAAPLQTNGSTDISKLFLFEPGKTKIINLLNTAPPATLALLNPCEELIINPKSHSVTITDRNGTYLGALPDDLAHKLIAMIGGGNKYEAYVKSVTSKNLTIVIREVFRAEKFINQPSFQTNITSTYTADSEELRF